MSSHNKLSCQTCGRQYPKTTGPRLSSIEFRRKINGIKSLEELISSKHYIIKFVKSRFRRHGAEEFEKQFLDNINEENIDDIRIWIFKYHVLEFPEQIPLLGKDPESPLYDFLHSNYSDISSSFHDFYDSYCQDVDNPLNKNHVSRALSAFGIKPAMKKVLVNGTPKCTMLLHVPEEELAELFRKNGY